MIVGLDLGLIMVVIKSYVFIEQVEKSFLRIMIKDVVW